MVKGYEVLQRAKEERILLNILKNNATNGQGIQLGITSL
jgi:hypothetical protein